MGIDFSTFCKAIFDLYLVWNHGFVKCENVLICFYFFITFSSFSCPWPLVFLRLFFFFFFTSDVVRDNSLILITSFAVMSFSCILSCGKFSFWLDFRHFVCAIHHHKSRLLLLIFFRVHRFIMLEISIKKEMILAKGVSSSDSMTINPGYSVIFFSKLDSERFRYVFLFVFAICATYFLMFKMLHHQPWNKPSVGNLPRVIPICLRCNRDTSTSWE